MESITDFRYRTAITKLRCSSHALEIERGRYQNPKVPRYLRLCLVCQVVEDEEHFVTNYPSGAKAPVFANTVQSATFFYII